ncbi:hypothetical protein [Nostoc spongiaeforme]|uniref:hypothetical protein n=1 Tax=Nostoc spongiaeforme TaxID=502487 RepID=UPI0036F1A966
MNCHEVRRSPTRSLCQLRKSCKILLSLIRSFSSASLGIYLVHPVFLSLLKDGYFGFSLSGFHAHPIYSIPLTAIMTFILSYLTISIFRKIAIMRILIGE